MYYLDKVLSSSVLMHITFSQAFMLAIGFLIMFLAIKKRYEPLLLLPLAFGVILANVPGLGLALPAFNAALASNDHSVLTDIAIALRLETLSTETIRLTFSQADWAGQKSVLKIVEEAGFSDGLLYQLYQFAVIGGAAPMFIFLGIGAMTNLSALIAHPKTVLLGIAAQFGIFATLLATAAFTSFGFMEFSLRQIAAISMIASADGALVVYSSQILAPELLATMTLIVYVSIALIPIIQPPLMRLLTTEQERLIKMPDIRHVTRTEKIMLPILILILTLLFLPLALPLLGMFCLGNLFKESTVTDRLRDVSQRTLLDISTLALGLAVGSQLRAEVLLTGHALAMLGLAVMALCVSTVASLLCAKLMNVFGRQPINPLIGAAAVSAIPLSAHVSHKLAQQEDNSNYLLVHAMGPNIAGFIASAIVAGLIFNYF